MEECKYCDKWDIMCDPYICGFYLLKLISR